MPETVQEWNLNPVNITPLQYIIFTFSSIFLTSFWSNVYNALYYLYYKKRLSLCQHTRVQEIVSLAHGETTNMTHTQITK